MLIAKEAAQILSVDPETLRRWEEKGTLPFDVHKTPGGHRRYPRSRVEALAAVLKGERDAAVFRNTVELPRVRKLDDEVAELLNDDGSRGYLVTFSKPAVVPKPELPWPDFSKHSLAQLMEQTDGANAVLVPRLESQGRLQYSDYHIDEVTGYPTRRWASVEGRTYKDPFRIVRFVAAAGPAAGYGVEIILDERGCDEPVFQQMVYALTGIDLASRADFDIEQLCELIASRAYVARLSLNTSMPPRLGLREVFAQSKRIDLPEGLPMRNWPLREKADQLRSLGFDCDYYAAS